MQLEAFKILSGEENMQIDNVLLIECDNPVLRLYAWDKPTLSLGKNQKLEELVKSKCIKYNIPIVRRITGGRALLHDKELTYSFVAPKSFFKNGDNVLDSYKEISQGLVFGFKELGVELEYPDYQKVSVKSGYCMGLSTGADLSYQGKKFVGSAQCRNKDCILQHGSILIDYDKKLLEDIFQENIENMISLKEINPNITDIDLLCNAIKKGFELAFDVEIN